MSKIINKSQQIYSLEAAGVVRMPAIFDMRALSSAEADRLASSKAFNRIAQ